MNFTHPTIILVSGANWLGSKLVELLLDQKVNVVVVDDFNEKNMPFIKKFSDAKNFVFIERDKINTLRESFPRIKYIIHLKHDINTTNDTVSSKYFLYETKFVDEVLTLATEKNSTYLLTTSLHLHKDFVLKKNFIRQTNQDAYADSDLQDFIEKTVKEYISKAGLNGRIVRLGNVYGPEMNLDTDPLLKQILYDALNESQIRIYGDGLEYVFYVYISDAIQGIVKALFKETTRGKVYSITDPSEISVQSIVNKFIELGVQAKTIRYLKRKSFLDPLYHRAYVPEESLQEIGWRPTVSFEKGIENLYTYFKSDVSVRSMSQELEPESETVDIAFKEGILHQVPEMKKIIHNNPEFEEKLNSQSSPIYNREKGSDVVTVEAVKKEGIMKKVVVTVTLAFIYIFLAAPIFQVVALQYELHNQAEKLNAFKANNFSGSLPESDLEDSARTKLSGVRWMLNLVHKEEYESDMLKVAKGIDNASKASQILSEKNIYQYVNLGSSIPDGLISQSQEVLALLNSSRVHLDATKNVNLPFGTGDEVKEVKKWTYDVESKVSNSLNYKKDTAGSEFQDQNILGVETGQ